MYRIFKITFLVKEYSILQLKHLEQQLVIGSLCMFMLYVHCNGIVSVLNVYR